MLSRCYLNGNARDVKVSDNFAYVADYINGLVILDISRPEKPDVVSILKIEDGAKSLDLTAETVFVATNKRSLIAIDVTDKRSPKILRQHSVNAIHTWDEWWGSNNIVFADGHIWSYFNDSPLFVFEYNSSGGFVQKAKFGNEPADWGWGNEIKVLNNLLYFSTETGIRVLDNNSLTYVIEELGFASGMEWTPEAVSLNGDTLYVSTSRFGVSGIEAYQIRDLLHPMKLEGGLGLGFAPQEMIFEDRNLFILTPAGIAIYSPDEAVKVTDEDNIQSVTPEAFRLEQSCPNPFNASTSIHYMLSEQGNVCLDIYNAEGEKVRTLFHGFKTPGKYKLTWNGQSDDNSLVSSGVYFCRLVIMTRTHLFSQTRKLILVK